MLTVTLFVANISFEELYLSAHKLSQSSTMIFFFFFERNATQKLRIIMVRMKACVFIYY